MNTETLYELRVLSGEQRGASSVIQPGQTLRIGQDWINEVVLQKAEGVAVLSFSSTGTLVLQVEQGGGAVAHRMLEAGSRAELDLYEPFTVGGSGSLWDSLAPSNGLRCSPTRHQREAPGLPHRVHTSLLRLHKEQRMRVRMLAWVRRPRRPPLPQRSLARIPRPLQQAGFPLGSAGARACCWEALRSWVFLCAPSPWPGPWGLPP